MGLTNVDLYRIDGNVGSLSNVQTSALNGGPLAGARNRIINGDMRIDQRNAGASISLAGAPFTVDRFVTRQGVATCTGQRSTVAPPDFTNSILYSVTTGASSSTGGTAYIAQNIEGLNMSDLNWGTANAKSVTLSFWVRSSIAGSYGISISSNDTSLGHTKSYAITAANTWEYKTIVFPGPTTGTWTADNSLFAQIIWDLGVGSSYSTSGNSWYAGISIGLTGGVKLAETTGATFYLTGVQLEAGTVATPFERRSYGQELSLCQRYYYRVISSVSDNNYTRLSISGQCASSTTAFCQVLFPVLMRTKPTSLETTGTASNYSPVNSTGSNISATAIAFNAASAHSGEVSATVASGLTAGNATILVANNNTTAFLGWSAEL